LNLGDLIGKKEKMYGREKIRSISVKLHVRASNKTEENLEMKYIGLTQNRVFLQQLTADGRSRSVVGGQILGVLRKSCVFLF
jgi:hypothetical protein